MCSSCASLAPLRYGGYNAGRGPATAQLKKNLKKMHKKNTKQTDVVLHDQ